MRVQDKSGVLANIAQICANNDISLETILQKSTDNKEIAMLLCATHVCKEKQIKQAIKEIEALEVLEDRVSMIRIEE
jgi:homoserine dehydrogenase